LSGVPVAEFAIVGHIGPEEHTVHPEESVAAHQSGSTIVEGGVSIEHLEILNRRPGERPGIFCLAEYPSMVIGPDYSLLKIRYHTPAMMGNYFQAGVPFEDTAKD